MTLTLGPLRLDPGNFAVMAILNRTPDSFFDGGRNVALTDALDAVARAVDESADIIDIGGVRAGYGPPVDVAEELARVVPIVTEVRERFPRVVISVDTWRSAVAERVVAAGADLINDSWAGADPELVPLASRPPAVARRGLA